MIESILILLSITVLTVSFRLFMRYSGQGVFSTAGTVLMFISAGLLLLTLNAYADDRIHVAIIDTGVDLSKVGPYMCYDGHLDLTGKGIQDVDGHGTNIAGILSKNLNTKTHCLQIIKWYHTSKIMVPNKLLYKAVERAYEYHAKYVNMSLSGDTYSEEEEAILAKLVEQGTVVSVAAGNNGVNLDEFCWIYPACYHIYSPNYVIVGNSDSKTSNTGKFITMEHGNDVEGFGITESGTSQATAVYLGKRIK